MTHQLTFVILSTGLDSFKEIRAGLGADQRAQLLAGGDDAEQLFQQILNLRPSAAVIALGEHPQTALLMIERLATECPATAIISAAYNPSPDLILRSMRAGARDFLRLPMIAEELKTVIDRTAEFSAVQTEEPKEKGRMVAVFSSKGGCGTSFVATNLAAIMGGSTVLVDLNLQAGDLPLFLGLEPKYSIADVAENKTRLDNALLTSYITPYSSNLSLLAAPREADSADDIEPEHVFEILRRLRERFDFVVLDPQHTFDAITLAALDQADDIILLLTLDIPAIRSAQRALEIFDRLGYSRKKIRIVVNRWSKMIDIDLRQVEKFIGQPVIGFVPSDYQTAVTSINLGHPLVLSNPTSKIAAELRRICAVVTGSTPGLIEPQAQRRGLWRSLFKREKPVAGFDLRTTMGKV
jgi:pilus assembly protein CpaE